MLMYSTSKVDIGNFNRKTQRLDSFWIGFCGAHKGHSTELLKVINIILCLSHGQGQVESGFSVNKSLLVGNLQEKSLVAQRIVKDYIDIECGGDLQQCPVTNTLLLSCRNAFNRYKLDMNVVHFDALLSGCLGLKKPEKSLTFCFA